MYLRKQLLETGPHSHVGNIQATEDARHSLCATNHHQAGADTTWMYTKAHVLRH